LPIVGNRPHLLFILFISWLATTSVAVVGAVRLFCILCWRAAEPFIAPSAKKAGGGGLHTCISALARHAQAVAVLAHLVMRHASDHHLPTALRVHVRHFFFLLFHTILGCSAGVEADLSDQKNGTSAENGGMCTPYPIIREPEPHLPSY